MAQIQKQTTDPKAVLDDLPPELILMILESISDYSTLYAFVTASPAVWNVYQLHKWSIRAALLANMAPELASLIEKVSFAINENSSVTLESLADGRHWPRHPGSKPGSDFLHPSNLVSLRVLGASFDIATGLYNLAAWVVIAQQEEKIKNRMISTGRLPLATILEALWHFRKLKYYRIPTNDVDSYVSHVDMQYARATMNKFKDSYVVQIADENLSAFADVLFILWEGYNQLLRHQLRPESGSLLDMLFYNAKMKHWTRDLMDRIGARYSQLHRSLVWFRSVPAGRLALMKRSLGGPDTYGKLTQSDLDAYHQAGKPIKQYLERFRPLLGLPPASTELVAERVAYSGWLEEGSEKWEELNKLCGDNRWVRVLGVAWDRHWSGL